MFPFEGKAGDILHVPDVSAITANPKFANTQVTLNAPTEGQFTLTINQHREASFLVEDILAVQSAYDLRSEYTKSAGYAIAQIMDQSLGNLHASLSISGRVIGSTGTTTFDNAFTNQTDITETGLRNLLERLDSDNVPAEGRALWIHPAQKNVLLAIARFTEYQMLGPGGMPIRTGQFGEIFGVPVYVSTQTSTSGTAHANLLFQRDAIALAIQSSPRVQAQYKQEYLGWLFTVDALYGYGLFRDSSAKAIYTPV